MREYCEQYLWGGGLYYFLKPAGETWQLNEVERRLLLFAINSKAVLRSHVGVGVCPVTGMRIRYQSGTACTKFHE